MTKSSLVIEIKNTVGVNSGGGETSHCVEAGACNEIVTPRAVNNAKTV